MKWPMVEISRFCQTGSGGTPSRNNAGDYYGGNIPWVKSGELNQEFVLNTEERITELAIKESSAKIVPAGAILVAMYGATVGKSALLGIDAATNQAICNIIPDPEAADTRYVWYALKNQLPYLLAQRVGGAQPNISQQIIKNTQIPLPLLSEQRRIVEILDQADHLRKLRGEADKKAELILPALFNKMFGGPATNPMGWPEMPLRQVIAKVEAGWSAVSEARGCTKDEFGVLKVSAVTSGRFLACEHKAVLVLQTDRGLLTPRRGDLLFSRANTRELVAASCVVEDDHPNLFLPDKLWRLILHPDRATAMYLKELFWNNGFRDRFRASASGSSGSMLNISQEAMLNTIAPIPPFKLQEEYSAKAWSLAAIAKERRLAGDALDTLWSNLLQRAFSGTLTAAWREAHMKELLAEMEQQAKYLN